MDIVGVAKNAYLALIKKLGDVYTLVIEGGILEIDVVVGSNSAD